MDVSKLELSLWVLDIIYRKPTHLPLYPHWLLTPVQHNGHGTHHSVGQIKGLCYDRKFFPHMPCPFTIGFLIHVDSLDVWDLSCHWNAPIFSIPTAFQHHVGPLMAIMQIPSDRPLPFVQKSPLLLGEIDGHLLEGHWHMKQVFFMQHLLLPRQAHCSVTGWEGKGKAESSYYEQCS